MSTRPSMQLILHTIKHIDYWSKYRLCIISRDKINQLRFLNTEKKRNNLIFWIFFIPGTPKDLLTYFVGLTDIKLGTFLIISMVARIPSVVSSTFGGHFIGTGNYWEAILLYGIVGILSLAGMFLYNKKSKNTEDNDEK